MKIIKYKKVKNKYKVYIDNEVIDLYENIILKHNLLLKKDITKDLLDKIIEDNNNEEAYEVSLKYINTKMRSKKEIELYLKKKEYDSNLINNTISRLEKINLINDDLYTKSYISDKINLSNDGPYKIKQSLYNKVDEVIIDKYINQIDKDSLKVKLEKLIDKKIPTIKNCNGNILKYKLINYFSNLGYDKYMIEEILSTKELNNNNGEKEYLKLYNKYSKKYSDYELNNILRQKLYQKGFDLDEIKKNID